MCVHVCVYAHNDDKQFFVVEYKNVHVEKIIKCKKWKPKGTKCSPKKLKEQ